MARVKKNNEESIISNNPIEEKRNQLIDELKKRFGIR